MKIVECVPNFSEGRNKSVIEAIAAAISSVEGVKLLDVDPGADTNRTVITFIGTPESVKEGAFAGIKKASELIDMSKHTGAHARMGATDVCPFIPVSEVSMEECVEISRQVGERVARELKIPVYLYENSATRPDRRNLAEIRSGEYEALEEKMKNPDFKPDFGEAVFNGKSGATVMGAREFLIAYNINLDTKDAKKAKKIANKIREKGTWKRDENNKIVKDKDGNKVSEPGLFKECKATGWYIDQYQQAQVTMNLTNYRVTPPYAVFDEVCRLAWEMGLRVTGSELVGLIPRDAIVEAGLYYLQKQGRCQGIPESEVVLAAVKSMGLEDISPFDPKKKIIEYYVADRPEALINMSISNFTDELSSDSPAPGGGSVAALCGALSAGLSSMVANLTYGKKGYTKYDSQMNELALKGQNLKRRFLEAIDADTDAFNEVMKAIKMKANSDEEQKIKVDALEAANKKASLIPMHTLKMTLEALEIAEVAAMHGNKNSISDAGVAALNARAAAKGAWYNVVINLSGIQDAEFTGKMGKEADEVLAKVEEYTKKVEKIVDEALGKAALSV